MTSCEPSVATNVSDSRGITVGPNTIGAVRVGVIVGVGVKVTVAVTVAVPDPRVGVRSSVSRFPLPVLGAGEAMVAMAVGSSGLTCPNRLARVGVIVGLSEDVSRATCTTVASDGSETAVEVLFTNPVPAGEIAPVKPVKRVGSIHQ